MMDHNFNSPNKNSNNRFSTNIINPKQLHFNRSCNKWLSEQKTSFFELNNGSVTSIMNFCISPITIPTDVVDDPIYLIQQFFIHNDAERQNEIKRCLQYNCSNKAIDKIILLNEKIYSSKELGVDDPKIEQVDIRERLSFKKVFEYVSNLPNAYIILSNSDIFFNLSLKRLKVSNMVENKKIYTLLRYEYNGYSNLKDCRIFGPRPDSQDTWIWHSKWKITENILKTFNFNLGMPGCDNKLTYLLSVAGFMCHNEPQWIHSYHYHKSNLRNYGNSGTKNSVNGPYYAIFPTGPNYLPPHKYSTFDLTRENIELRNYLTETLQQNKNFIIPRIAGIENEIAVFGALLVQNGKVSHDQMEKVKKQMNVMKSNAGISLTNVNDICEYGKDYLNAFHKCNRYFWWAPWGNVIRWIPNSFHFITENFAEQEKFDSLALDIFNSIQNEPWTRALKGKRILIVSAFIESIKEKISIRKEIYGIDLFPDCEFVFLKPPQTHGENESRSYPEELKEFVERIRNIKDTFDIALCSCGGYGNPICSAIYDMDKSAIYVGGVLQMYFGIYGERWLRERPDIMKIYLNKHWSRPKESERPDNYKNVEKACYW